jgi:phage portal protein BeeE
VSIYVAPRLAKAITGPGAATMQTNPPLAAGLFLNSAQMMMRAYWQAAHRNPWISGSERLISGKVSGVEWHLESGGEDLVDSTNPLAVAALMLMEKPQANVREGKQMTRRELWNQTSRFMGLTGNAFWLMDERNAVGLPNSLLWIRPDRMTPAEDSRGNLTGWVLDAQQGASVNGQRLEGIPLDLDQILHFTLIPPDEGHFGMGLVEAALRKVSLTELADTYASGTLASGGRLSGIVSGTQNSPIPDEVFKQLVRDLRAVTEQPDAARRTTVVQGDINWKPTGMTPLDVGLVDIMKLSRDDTFGIWQAPFSLVYGGSQATGLNSGETRKYDEAALWQGPVHDRLVVISEVVQFQMFDRIAGGIELVIEEPEFDDDSPRYDLLGKSVNTPLTNKERRELIGLDPFGDPVLDDAVWLPATMVTAFQAPPDDTAPSPTETTLGRVSQTDTAPPSDATAALAGKASRYTGLHQSLVNLRTRLQASQTPRIKSAVGKFLDAQRHEIATRIRAHAEHIKKEPGDTSVWWNAAKWDKALKEALTPYLSSVADNVSAHVGTVLAPVPGKADPVGAVLERGAARVTRINQTTRDAIAEILAQAIENDLVLSEVADSIEATDFASFDEYRAELIARTELMDAYNSAALGSYGEAGIEMVEAIDGDEDEECIARLAGNPYTLDDAMAEEDHPNGTLDWVPADDQATADVIEPQGKALTIVKSEPEGPRMAHAMELYLAEQDAKDAERRSKAEAEITARDDRLAMLAEQFAALARDALIPREPPQITNVIHVPEFPPTVVNVAPSAPVVVPAANVTLNVPEAPKRVVKTVVRDADKQIVGSIEERA